MRARVSRLIQLEKAISEEPAWRRLVHYETMLKRVPGSTEGWQAAQ
jgi:hypothetical protein